MMTGKDPGRLGFYGFRNRSDYSYDELSIATSQAVKEDTVWDILSREGKRVVLVGVPQTYPPKPVNGLLVSCFLTPSTQSQFTYPASLKSRIEGLVGNYMLDVEDFRTDDKDRLLRRIYEMTVQHLFVVKNLLTEEDWDFFMYVEMGIDRMHHGFWKYFDPTHPKYVPANPYEAAVKDYYKYLDQAIGEILALIDDRTSVLVVSDHGAKKMDGGICINEWLIKEGYLVLKEKVSGVLPLEKVEVDWSRTRAWGGGGYYGRLFINVAGREPEGVVPPADYEHFREELAQRICALGDDQGREINTKVYKPQEVYKECRGIPPDLIIYFGDLYWRAVGSVGHQRIHVFDNDTGPDDANHAAEGIWILHEPGKGPGGEIYGLRLIDCAPTILNLLGVRVPNDMQGKIVRKKGVE